MGCLVAFYLAYTYKTHRVKEDGGSSSGTVNTGVRAERSEALNTSITVPKLLPPSVPPIPRVFVAIRRLTPAPGAALGAARSPIFHRH